MNIDDITRMAWANGYMLRERELAHLLPLFQAVAAAEREACAQLCEEFDAENPYIGQGRACAFEIRARDAQPPIR
jgi:hypothetical protein